MARERTDPETQKEVFYKLSNKAVEQGFKPTWIDVNMLTVLPETSIYRQAGNGQKILDETRPAVGIVKDANQNEISRTVNGFVNLTPQQVYELTSNGVIILSSKRSEHKEIYFGYLKANCTDPNNEDY